MLFAVAAVEGQKMVMNSEHFLCGNEVLNSTFFAYWELHV
jgi:hypothetical protein